MTRVNLLGGRLTDAVSMNVPLAIRMMEYAKEDASNDVELHQAMERAIHLQKHKHVLDMMDYPKIVGGMMEPRARGPRPDAFEREFGEREGPRRRGGTKCSKVNPTGTPYECLRAGIFVGKNMEGEKTTRRVKTARVAGEAAATARTMKDYKTKIQRSALAELKKEVSLGSLKADELRSIVARLHKTGNLYPGPGSHTNASKLQLTNWLQTQGFHQ